MALSIAHVSYPYRMSDYLKVPGVDPASRHGDSRLDYRLHAGSGFARDPCDRGKKTLSLLIGIVGTSDRLMPSLDEPSSKSPVLAQGEQAADNPSRCRSGQQLVPRTD